MRRTGLKTLATALLLAWAVATPALAQPPQMHWRDLRPGLELGFLEAGEGGARTGSDRVAVLRVDPRRYTFKVLAAEAGAPGLNAGEWRQSSGALAVFNAGQYATDRSYLGLLVRDGKVLSRLASRPEGLFLADPADPGLPPARVIDLRYTPFDTIANPYRQAAQSLMLLDRFGQVRVRRSPKVAHRTAVAEDDQGRILVFVTEGGHTLWEFAKLLGGAGLGLREVMSMDGGAESQFDLEVDGEAYSQYGGPSATPDLPWPTPALPAALAVFAK